MHIVLLILVSAVMITLGASSQLGKQSFYVLLLIAIFFLVKNIKNLAIEDRDLKFVFITLLLWLSWTILTNLWNGVPELSMRSLWRRQFFIISIIPLFFLFRRYPLNKNILLLAIIFASLLLIANAVYDVFYLGLKRSKGGPDEIQLGSNAVLLFILLTSIQMHFRFSLNLRFVIVISILSLFAAIILSGTRGIWLALPVLLINMILFSSNMRIKKYRLHVLLIALLGLFSTYFIPVVQDRVDQTVNRVVNYMQTPDVGNTKISSTSVGTRFEMWKAAWFIFTEHPVKGVGLGGYEQAAIKYQEKYGYGDRAFAHYHPHNQYLSELASKGLPGLILFVLFLGALVYYFYRGLRQNDHNRWIHFAGLQAAILIIILCLTNATFESKSMILAMSLYFALLFSFIPVAAKAEN